jgi:predicted phosphodiesterase
MHHGRLIVPPGDVLVHAGDATSRGTSAQLKSFAAFIAAQPHAHKVVIAGNHDFGLEQTPTLGAELFGAAYLSDSGRTIDGVRVWGSPWQPWFYDWAFNLQRGDALAAKWALIPDDTDVLVTHGPPMGVLDKTLRGEPVGCEALRDRVAQLRPRLHVFGHIHEAYGVHEQNGTLFVNACNCTLAYEPDNAAIVVDLPRDRSKPAVVVAGPKT